VDTQNETDPFSIATFNLGNLYETYDDPLTDDDILSAAEYQRRLNKRALTIHEKLNEPKIITLQEAEEIFVQRWIGD
jgi:hypothetical protein